MPRYKQDTADLVSGLGCVGAWFAIMGTLGAAWITHVIVCIKASAWILLAFGCVVAPVGIIHGIGVWFGVF